MDVLDHGGFVLEPITHKIKQRLIGILDAESGIGAGGKRVTEVYLNPKGGNVTLAAGLYKLSRRAPAGAVAKLTRDKGGCVTGHNGL